MFIAAVPITKLFALWEGDRGDMREALGCNKFAKLGEKFKQRPDT